jgi:hypothetical protein
MKKIGLGYFIHALFWFSMGALLLGQPWKEKREPVTIGHEMCLTEDRDLEAVVHVKKIDLIKVVCKPQKD